ncbi:MspA family porin [Gordonia sp. DT218]|uniref:MspA family porin n=1 Tax=Gordonia sp. DT218 TaxID=3416659 RepID=UPI003CFACCB2
MTSARRVLGFVALAGIASVAMTTLTPDANAGPLPGGSTSSRISAGATMHAQLAEERVTYHRGNVASVPTSREVWVSGKVRVQVTGAATGGVIKGGYVVGCQVDLLNLGNSGGAGVNPSTGAVTGPTMGSTLSLGPGQATYVPLIAETNTLLDADNELYRISGYKFTGPRGSVAYSQEPLRLNGCGGYAQARARMTIQVSTPTSKSETTLWGRPFSLG